jgi:molecular chaperone IbpA
MRDFDLSPLYRSTVGFDSLVSVFDQIAGFENEASLIRRIISSV